MSLENDKYRRKLRYRYTLIYVLFIIIILLVIALFIVKNNNQLNANYENEISNEHEDDAMVVEIEEKKKIEEEQKKQAELEKAKEEQLKKEEENASGIIYLTFDDGPTLDSTPKILDILSERNIKATFFVLHYSNENEKFIKREQEDGHTVALHGYTHTYSEVYASADSCMENFRKIQNQVKNTTGVTSHIIRFPGGSSNTISRKYCKGVMTELSKRVVDEGFRYFDWNVDSDDAGRAKTKEDIYKNVTTGLHQGRGNVVLMHDFGGNYKTIDALDAIIDYGLENGFVFRKITDETPMVTHSVNN